MKRFIQSLGIIFIAIVLTTGIAQATTYLFPFGGGTGTSTPPLSGQFLMGNSINTYSPTGTSTALDNLFSTSTTVTSLPPQSYFRYYGGNSTNTASSTSYFAQNNYLLNNDPRYLSKWRACLSKVKSGTANCRVVFVGDSTTIGVNATGAANWPNESDYIGTYLNQFGIPATTNSWVGNSAGGTGSRSSVDTRISKGSWTTSLLTLGGGIYQAVDTTAGTFAYTPNVPVDTFNLFYTCSGGLGTMQISIDSGSAIDVVEGTPCTGGTINVATLTTTVGTHTFNIVYKNGSTGTVFFLGIEAYNSNTKSVNVMNAGWFGSKVADWADVSAFFSPLNMLKSTTLAPSLVVLKPGINDWSNATSYSSFRTSVQSIITSVKAAGSDIIIETPNPSSTADTIMDPYIDILYSLAQSNNVPLVDNFNKFQSYTISNALGYYADTVHPTTQGYADMASTLTLPLIQQTSGGFAPFIIKGSNVGVGTTTPWAVFSIAGNPGGVVPLFNVSNSTSAFATSSALLVDNLGNVGIATTSPYSMLSVAGQIVGQNYVATSTIATSTFAGPFSSNKGAFMWNGLLGLGTTSPSSLLHVEGNDATAYTSSSFNSLETTIQNTNSTNNSFGDIRFRTIDAGGSGSSYGRITGVATSHTAGAVSGDIIFSTRNAGTISDVLTIKSTGNVGIGTTTPLEKLSTACSTGYCTNRIDSGVVSGYFSVNDVFPSVNVGSNSNHRLNFIVNNGVVGGWGTNGALNVGETNKVSLRSNVFGGYLYIQADGTGDNGEDTIAVIQAPVAQPQEADLALRREDPLNSNNSEFSDLDDECYGTPTLLNTNCFDHFASWVVAKRGTGQLRPFGIRFWNQDLGSVAATGWWTFLTDPSGATAIGTFASTTYDKTIPLQVASSTAATLFQVSAAIGTPRFNILSSGNTGIGTSSPFAKLSIQSTSGSQPLFVIASSTTGTGTTTQFVVDPFGNVGIGYYDSNPNRQNPLQISSALNTASNIEAPSNYNLLLRNNSGANGSGTGIAFSGGVDGGYSIGGSMYFIRQGSNSFGDLAFALRPTGGVMTERMRLTSTGFLGIGTTTATASFVSVAASSTVASTPYAGLVHIIAGLENGVTKLFQEIDQWGHEIVSGDAPTLTSCVGGSVNSASNDRAGAITFGTGLTSCGVLFAHAYPAGTTIHVFVNQDTGTLLSSGAQSVSTTGFTVTAASIATGDVFSYQVVASQ